MLVLLHQFISFYLKINCTSTDFFIFDLLIRQTVSQMLHILFTHNEIIIQSAFTYSHSIRTALTAFFSSISKDFSCTVTSRNSSHLMQCWTLMLEILVRNNEGRSCLHLLIKQKSTISTNSSRRYLRLRMACSLNSKTKQKYSHASSKNRSFPFPLNSSTSPLAYFGSNETGCTFILLAQLIYSYFI
mgnify:FL=1